MVLTVGETVRLRNEGSYLTAGPLLHDLQVGSLGHIVLSVPRFFFACEVGCEVTFLWDFRISRRVHWPSGWE